MCPAVADVHGLEWFSLRSGAFPGFWKSSTRVTYGPSGHRARRLLQAGTDLDPGINETIAPGSVTCDTAQEVGPKFGLQFQDQILRLSIRLEGS